MKWELIKMSEQETLISFDYFEKVINIYTSRSIVYNKLVKKIGKPSKMIINNNLACGADWNISFNDRKRIIKILTLSNLLMNKKRKTE